MLRFSTRHTPPKRVPVLWDGPAPAPSKESEFLSYRATGINIAKYRIRGMLRIRELAYDLGAGNSSQAIKEAELCFTGL